jgi:hypothetical protein
LRLLRLLELLRRDPPLRLDVLRPELLRADVLRDDVLRREDALRDEPLRDEPLLREEPLRDDALLRERDDVLRRLLLRRRPVDRCEAGISAVATAFVSCGISFSR